MLPLCSTNTKPKRALIFDSAEFMVLQRFCSWRYLKQLAASAGTLLTSEELPMGVTVPWWSHSLPVIKLGEKVREKRYNVQARLMDSNQPKAALCNVRDSNLYLLRFRMTVPFADWNWTRRVWRNSWKN